MKPVKKIFGGSLFTSVSQALKDSAMAAVTVPRVKLGSQGLEVSQQGLGCMGMSAFYGPPKPEEEMISLLEYAVDSGITFWDTADMYGPHTNEVLLGKALKRVGRNKVQLATKFANSFSPDHQLVIRGDPEYVRACCEDSLKRLDVDCIDLYYQHRQDKNIPIEITVGEMKKLLEEGKVKYLGLSECSADTIRRAHSVHPITAVQMEWSLWSREVEPEILPLCRELGIGIVSYSPLGRGFFSGLNVATLSEGDTRAHGAYLPRFSEENMVKNKAIFDKLSEIAGKKKATPGQIALAWVHLKGKDVVPIPGTTKKRNLDENVGALRVQLSQENIAEMESFCQEIGGERYGDMSHTRIETPPLSSWKPEK